MIGRTGIDNEDHNINWHTILSIDDIAEHREDLRDEPDEQEVDDMLVRFAMTFTESLESEVTE